MKSNVILIGMPGAGKSTVGVVLAKRLGYRFLDSDLLIQEQTGKLLHELISGQGLESFLKTEEEVNASIQTEHSVIATGGSVVYGPKAMEHLHQIGTIVYLELPYRAIADRLGNLKERGVALKEGQTLMDLYRERVPLYEQYADITIHCKSMLLREVAEKIQKQVS